jgi:hypothetical protein
MQSLARLGGSICAIDASAENVNVAKAHAARDANLSTAIDYRAQTAGICWRTWLMREKHAEPGLFGSEQAFLPRANVPMFTCYARSPVGGYVASAWWPIIGTLITALRRIIAISCLPRCVRRVAAGGGPVI